MSAITLPVSHHKIPLSAHKHCSPSADGIGESHVTNVRLPHAPPSPPVTIWSPALFESMIAFISLRRA